MGYFFDDLTEGQTFESVGRTITEYDVMAFAGLSGDYNQLHTNREYAKASPFGERIAHGLLVVAIATGLTAQMGLFDGTGLALLGLDWKFKGPVLLNDTIRFRMTIQSKKATSKPDRGVVVRRYEMLNQRNEVVQDGTITLMVRRKAA